MWLSAAKRGDSKQQTLECWESLPWLFSSPCPLPSGNRNCTLVSWSCGLCCTLNLHAGLWLQTQILATRNTLRFNNPSFHSYVSLSAGLLIHVSSLGTPMKWTILSSVWGHFILLNIQTQSLLANLLSDLSPTKTHSLPSCQCDNLWGIQKSLNSFTVH